MQKKSLIQVLVYRSPGGEVEDSEQGGDYHEYEVEYKDRMTVMNVFDYIHEKVDRSLAYYKSCRIGKCTGCLVEVDGKNRLACTTLVREGMKIGPARGYRVIRDLVVDL